MQTRHFTLTITANVVAWYAAIMSTIIAMVQLANYLRDRVKLQIDYQRDMEMVNNPAYAGLVLTFITVVNVGRRRLTVTSVAARRSGNQNRSWVFTDTIPRLPCPLEEGTQLQVIVDQAGLNFDEILWFSAYDAAGRQFRKNVAGWFRRVGWAIRRKLSKKKTS